VTARAVLAALLLWSGDLAAHEGLNQLHENNARFVSAPVPSEVPPASEQLMRMIFALWLIPPDARAEVMKEIAEKVQQLNPQKGSKSTFSEHPAYPEIVHWWQPNDICLAS
jgi:hypothetical protein